eukprot:5401750-Alexandrium_andersonii.AAC.1
MKCTRAPLVVPAPAWRVLARFSVPALAQHTPCVRPPAQLRAHARACPRKRACESAHALRPHPCTRSSSTGVACT